MKKYKALLPLLGAAMMLPAHLHAAGAGCANDYFGPGEYTGHLVKSSDVFTSTYAGNVRKAFPRTDGIGNFTTYYPYGTKTTTETVRYTRLVYGYNIGGFGARGRICYDDPQVTTAAAVPAPSMVQCTSCGNASYGWQVMIVSSRNIESDLMKAPVVVSQGFDPDFTSAGEFSFESFEKSFKAIYPVSGENNPSLPTDNALKRLVDEGYDVVFVKFNNPSLDIRAQGKNFLEAMNWVASKSVPNAFQYLVGPSMGGQVVRSALIEYYNQKAASNLAVANTRVSGALLFDSPNLGASIPASGYFAMKDHRDFDATSNVLYANMSATSAQQMLYRTSSGTSWVENSTAKSFYADLNTPENIRKMNQDGRIDLVAISNGSAAGVTQGLPSNTTFFSGSKQLYRQTLDLSGYTLGVGGTATLTATMSTSLKTGPAEGSSNSPFNWGLTMAGNNLATASTSATNDGGLENSPGGYRTTFKQLADALDNTYSRNTTRNTAVNNHSFIPTISSLGLLGRSLGKVADLNRSIVAVGAPPTESSIFSRIYAPRANQPHVALTSENMGWMLLEIKRASAKASSLSFTSNMLQ